MKIVSTEAWWIAVLEADDTGETVARWIEENTSVDEFNEVRYNTGDVDCDAWPVEPKPGDVIVFNAPSTQRTQRYPAWVQVLPPVEPLVATMEYTQLHALYTDTLGELETVRAEYAALMRQYDGLKSEHERLITQAWNETGVPRPNTNGHRSLWGRIVDMSTLGQKKGR